MNNFKKGYGPFSLMFVRLFVFIGFTSFIGLAFISSYADGSELYGKADCTYGSADCNVCVPDASNVLNRLSSRGEVMGFRFGGTGYTDLDGTIWHIQGIQRLPYISGTSFNGHQFVIDISHPADTDGSDGWDNSKGTHLGIADLMYHRGGAGFLGSNRMSTLTQDWNVTPNINDTLIPIGDPPTSTFVINYSLNHPGGISLLGKYLFVPLQKYDCGLFGGLFGCETPPDSEPAVYLYNLGDLTPGDGSDPDNPVKKWGWWLHNYGGDDNMANAAAKLSDGRFLLISHKSTNGGDRLEFYISQALVGTPIYDSGLFGNDHRDPDVNWMGENLTFIYDGDVDSSTPNGWRGYNNINLVTGCGSGQLYLIAFDRMDGTDWADLYRVDLYETPSNGAAVYSLEMTKVDSLKMFCTDNSGDRECDFDAGAGSYVDPLGKIVVYATTHSNDGQPTGAVVGGGQADNFVEMMEFREHLRNESCNTLDDSWVEFYEHDNYRGQILRVDGRDITKRNYGDYSLANYFNDKITSARWCIPGGYRFGFWEDAYGSGGWNYLNGSGVPVEQSTFVGIPFYGSGNDINDKISSSWDYLEECPGGVCFDGILGTNEICDGIDNDFDIQVDEDFPDTDSDGTASNSR